MDPANAKAKSEAPSRAGLAGGASAAAAFLVWGMYPLYFKAVGQVPAYELMLHRVVWSTALLGVIVMATRRGAAVAAVARERRLLGALLATALLLSVNWTTYIWAVVHDNVLEASLGYYINPLMNVALGVVVLRERLTAWQGVAVLLAVVGVANLVVRYGEVPWLGLIIAASFSLYGLVRKVAMLDAFTGLFVETAILFGPAAAALAWLGVAGDGAFGRAGAAMSGLLALAGVVTIIPLLLFAEAVKRLRYATVGFFHYITPTSLFLLAVFAYREPITPDHLVTFGLIWAGLVVYTLDTSLAERRRGGR